MEMTKSLAEEKSRGKFESQKYAALRPDYDRGFKQSLQLGFDETDYINQFPAFVGHLTLARYLSLYEGYKMVKDVAGHIAEAGVFKASGSLLFAKLLKLHEPASMTMVHGFDWFQGAKITEEEKYVQEGECQVSFEQISSLIEAQGCKDILHLHNLDLTKDLPAFFEENSHLRFKLVFIDIGIYEVLRPTIEHFWRRITPGGIMIFDHYSHEFAPGEVRAIEDVLPHARVKTFEHGWMPSAYIMKD